MNSELATNNIRIAIGRAIRLYHDKKTPVDATHVNELGTYYKKQFGNWYQKSPFDKQWHGVWDMSVEYAAGLFPIKHFTQSTV